MRVAVIHFQPLEKYPPAVNFIEFLDKEGVEAKVWSTELNDSYNVFNVAHVSINRFAGIKVREHKLLRFFKYLNFNLKVLFDLFFFRPDRIIYFETISGLPALIYKFFFTSKVKIFVHYHEYTSVKEYDEGMFINRYIHILEKEMYELFEWISHTNETRAKLFKNDIDIKLNNIKILPNYPPKKWLSINSKNQTLIKKPVKMVYVGALCTETMYLREICCWIEMQHGEVSLDIWSHNISEKAKEFLSKSLCPWVKIKGGINYNDLPAILKKYHVGLILYKGHIPNYIHNAPNKLFEYLVCGINVLFPEELTGAYPYICESSAPVVKKINFNNLSELQIDNIIKWCLLDRREIDFYSEKIYSYFLKHIYN